MIQVFRLRKQDNFGVSVSSIFLPFPSTVSSSVSAGKVSRQ
ncbi:hypothetical protein V6Z12_A05G208600 [Gossypium hirsutum]